MFDHGRDRKIFDCNEGIIGGVVVREFVKEVVTLIDYVFMDVCYLHSLFVSVS